MNHKPFHLDLEERSGDRFASLEEAQRAALPFAAALLVKVLKDLQAKGDLVVVNGTLVVNPNRASPMG